MLLLPLPADAATDDELNVNSWSFYVTRNWYDRKATCLRLLVVKHSDSIPVAVFVCSGGWYPSL